jgi:hypothetical protein
LKLLPKLTHELWKLHTKNYKQQSNDVKVRHPFPFFLEFKIDPKIFSFIPNFINKSCRV